MLSNDGPVQLSYISEFAMPISEKFLRKRTNHHLLVSAKETISDVFAKFQAVGGKSWWVFIIDYGENRYGLLWISDIAKQMGFLGNGPPDWDGALSYDEQVRLFLKSDELVTSFTPSAMLETVGQNNLSDQEAWLLAERSPGRALIVLNYGKYIGLVNNRYIVRF